MKLTKGLYLISRITYTMLSAMRAIIWRIAELCRMPIIAPKRITRATIMLKNPFVI